MSDKFLPYGRQVIEDDDVQKVVDVLRGDWLTTGPVVENFERQLAAKVGAKYAVACSSGTAGLHLAMLAAGLGSGDEAVVPSVTFVATANAVRFVGGEVVFCDVDPHTGLMGTGNFQEALGRVTGRARAVVPVHLAGQTADMPALSAIARQHEMIVIEDACHALGTTYRFDDQDIPVGSCRHSDMAVFSFHPVKNIAMGEGGAVTTNDESLYEKLLRFRSHGIVRSPREFENIDLAFDSDGDANPWYYEMPDIGFNYRASDINCALASSQLSKLDGFVERRRSLVGCYDSSINRVHQGILAPARVAGCNPAWHLYAIRIDFSSIAPSRAVLMKKLRDANIGSQVHYIPVHLQPYYRERYGEQQLPGAMTYYRSTLSLPLFASMTEADVTRVVRRLEAAI